MEGGCDCPGAEQLPLGWDLSQVGMAVCSKSLCNSSTELTQLLSWLAVLWGALGGLGAFSGFSLAGSGQPQGCLCPQRWHGIAGGAGCTSKLSAIHFILAKNDLVVQVKRIIDNLLQPGESCSLLCGVSKCCNFIKSRHPNLCPNPLKWNKLLNLSPTFPMFNGLSTVYELCALRRPSLLLAKCARGDCCCDCFL